jgi:hypothetical protein
MKLIVALLLGFLCIGLFFRDFDKKTRLCLLLVAASAVVYATLK